MCATMLVFGGGMNLVLGLVEPAFDLLGSLPSLKIPLISRHDGQVHDPNTWKVNEGRLGVQDHP